MLVRYFPKGSVPTENATYIDVILYSREQIILENQATWRSHCLYLQRILLLFTLYLALSLFIPGALFSIIIYDLYLARSLFQRSKMTL